jgi:hypothetical protein
VGKSAPQAKKFGACLRRRRKFVGPFHPFRTILRGPATGSETQRGRHVSIRRRVWRRRPRRGCARGTHAITVQPGQQVRQRRRVLFQQPLRHEGALLGPWRLLGGDPSAGALAIASCACPALLLSRTARSCLRRTSISCHSSGRVWQASSHCRLARCSSVGVRLPPLTGDRGRRPLPSWPSPPPAARRPQGASRTHTLFICDAIPNGFEPGRSNAARRRLSRDRIAVATSGSKEFTSRS